MEHESVQLWEGGPYWATTNIGAKRPEDSGLYFMWGCPLGYRHTKGEWVDENGIALVNGFAPDDCDTDGRSVGSLFSNGVINGSGVVSKGRDAATFHWGAGWRLPTYEELSMLVDCCDWERTRWGFWVNGRGQFARCRISLPAAGHGRGPSLFNAGSFGNYWSSVPYSDGDDHAWNLDFGPSSHVTDYNVRSYGFSVRPVQGFAS